MSDLVLYHAPESRPFSHIQATMQFDRVLSYLNARRTDGSGDVPCIDAVMLLGALHAMAAVLLWHGFSRDEIQRLCTEQAEAAVLDRPDARRIRGYIDFGTGFARHALSEGVEPAAAVGHLRSAMQNLLHATFLASAEEPRRVAFQVYTGFRANPLPEQLALG